MTTVLWGEWELRLLPRATPHLRCAAAWGPGEPLPRERIEGPTSLPFSSAGCELSQERRTWTFRPQLEGKQNCRLLLHTVGVPKRGEEDGVRRLSGPNRGLWVSPVCPQGDEGPLSIFKPAQICLGEKAKEEMHRVEILPPANQEDKKMQPVTIASLQASVLPMVGLSLLAGKLLPAPASPSPSPLGGDGHTRGCIHPTEVSHAREVAQPMQKAGVQPSSPLPRAV